MSLFFFQLRSELIKLFARKRTHIGFGAFFAVELLVLALFQIDKVQKAYRGLVERAGFGSEHYFSGLTMGMIIVMSTGLLTMLFLALVGGDVIAKEVEDGTLRMALCRPISRLRLLVIKYLACVIYTFLLVLFIGCSALAVGLMRHGTGGLFVYAPEQQVFALFEWHDGLIRYSGALLTYSLSFVSVTSLAFMLSCFNMKPSAATIVTLTFFVIDFIFYHFPYFNGIKDWFVTKNMATWVFTFQEKVPWQQMCEDYAYLFGLDATLVVIGAAVFLSRDFKS